MGHRSVIARYTSDGSPLVISEPFADRLRSGPWDAAPYVGEPPDSGVRCVRVSQLLDGAPVSRLSCELERGGNDILVVLLVAEPAHVPVGPLLQAVLRHGYRVVEATPVASRMARTVLVLTRDPAVPLAAYLTGEPIEGEEAVRRAVAEHLVEGMVVRAQREHERADALAARAEAETATRELGAARRAHQEALQRASAAEQEFAALRQQLAAYEQGRLGARARGLVDDVARAARVVRDDPVHGVPDVARALRQRARRR